MQRTATVLQHPRNSFHLVLRFSGVEEASMSEPKTASMSEPKAACADRVSLKVATDLEQDEKYFPRRSDLHCLSDRIADHWSLVPAEIRCQLLSRTVSANESVRRETIGAANPFALAATEARLGQREGRPVSASTVEKEFGEHLATLTDPTQSDLLYPGLRVENNIVRLHHIGPDSPDTTEWVDDGIFFNDAVHFTDPIQGGLADCYFIAALASTAWAHPFLISQRSAPSDQQVEYANSTAADEISFFDSSGRHDVSTTGLLPQLNGSWLYARADDPKELWPGVYEKAFAMWKIGTTSEQPDMTLINYGDPVAAGIALTNGSGSYFPTSEVLHLPLIGSIDLVTPDQIWQTVRAHSLGMRTVHPMMAWTPGSAPAGLDYGSAQIVLNHAYSILGWDYRNGTEYIVLRNPWATYEATVDVLSGTWTAFDATDWRVTTLSTAGVFAITAETFKQYYQGFGVVEPPAAADVQ
jgi:Calpain family cysteine protease